LNGDAPPVIPACDAEANTAAISELMAFRQAYIATA
jgi:hypothetical protein